MNDFKDQRLRCFIDNYLDKFDVICLQEMFGAFSRRRRKLIKAAHKKGFHWKVSSPQGRSSMFLVDGGCLILSRVKIVADAYTIFSPGVQSDRLAAKGVVYAKLNPKPGVFVHLFVTHLQAVYTDPESNLECLSVQKRQYDELVEFVASTVAANETAEDMLQAQRLREKKRRKDINEEGTMRGKSTPPDQDLMYVSRKCRRWPIIVCGDFNCNSRPTPGDLGTKITRPYADLTSALSKIGPFSDVLYDAMGEHPVTYAACQFQLDGSFVPQEISLTTPDDYKTSEFVNQSLDYVFCFPPTHEDVQHRISSTPQFEADGEMSPDSRAIRGSVLRPEHAQVQHLKYLRSSRAAARNSDALKYVSDHFAIETVFSVNTDDS